VRVRRRREQPAVALEPAVAEVAREEMLVTESR
jgi:hypothetical protein